MPEDTGAFAHWGARMHWMLFRGSQRRGIKWKLILSGLLFLAVLASFFLRFFLIQEFEELLDILFSIFSVLFVFYMGIIPGFLSGFRARKDFLNRVVHPDAWVALILTFGLIESFLGEAWRSIEFPTRNVLWLASIDLLLVLWILFRIAEAAHFRRKYFRQKPDLSWGKGDPSARALQLERKAALVGILSVAICSLLLYAVLGRAPLSSPTLVVAAVFPALLPYFSWFFHGLLSSAQDRLFVCESFQEFEELRRPELLSFQFTGAVTSLEPEFLESWFDSSDSWAEDEIKDVLHQLSLATDHPVSKLIRLSIPHPSKSLIKLDRVEMQAHLGISAVFTDYSGKQAHAVLVATTWHKVLQHEIDSLGLEKLREWKTRQARVSFLAINRKIVAAVAFSYPIRPNLESHLELIRENLKLPCTLISSDLVTLPAGLNPFFMEAAVNLLPLERNVQFQYWSERKKEILEVAAWWDLPDENARKRIIYADHAHARNASPHGKLLGNDLSGLLWALTVARQWKSFRSASWLLIVFGCSISALTQQPLLFGCVFFISGLLGAQKMSRGPRIPII